MVHARNDKPVKRVLGTVSPVDLSETGDQFVVTLCESSILVRPKGAKCGGPAEVCVHVASLYRTHFAPPAKAKRAPKVKRGLLT